jgi:multidrug efflux system outer membrane protein
MDLGKSSCAEQSIRMDIHRDSTPAPTSAPSDSRPMPVEVDLAPSAHPLPAGLSVYAFGLGVLLACLFQGCATAGENHSQRASLTPPMLAGQIPWRQAAPKDLGARGSWWEVFKDPVLSWLEMQATTGKLDVPAAAARVEQARGITGIGVFGQDPDAELNFFHAVVRAASSPPGSDLSESVPRSAEYDVNELVVPLYTYYELDVWARVRRSTKGATPPADESLAVRQAVLFTLEGEIAQTYFLIRYSDEELRILRESIELGKKAVGLVAARTADGSTGELDLARARKQVDYAQVEAKRVSERRADLERSLAVLLGVAPERFRVAPSPFDLKPPAIPPGVPSDLLERRPDIVQAERALATRGGETDLAGAVFFPSLPLTASNGAASSELMALLDWHGNNSLLGASLWQPPFSAGRIEFDADNAGAIYDGGAFDEGMPDYRRRIRGAFVEVEDALTHVRLLDQQAQYDATALGDSQRAARPGTVRRQDPLLALAEANNAQRVSLQARRQVLRDINDRMLTTVALIKALGGGWSRPRELSARTTSPEPSN